MSRILTLLALVLCGLLVAPPSYADEAPTPAPPEVSVTPSPEPEPTPTPTPEPTPTPTPGPTPDPAPAPPPPPTTTPVPKPHYPHAGEVPGAVDTSHRVGHHKVARSSVFMVGDSIANSVYYHGLHKARPGWEISSVPGRDVSNAPWYVWDRLASRVVPVRTVIWALGSDADPHWSWTDFRRTVKRLPKGTRLVFVTDWRDPSMWSRSKVSDYRRQSEPLQRYDVWMRKIAAKRPSTCLFDWERIVSAHPQYLHDGVHPTDYGAKLYTSGITRVAGGRCR